MGKTDTECPYCFGTGCSCGGIGFGCHGCCSCTCGERARERREQALKEVRMLIASVKRGSNVDSKR
jgi:hypothetical protein